MVLQITRAGKGTLSIETPVMSAAGITGFADEYRGLIKLEKLGALVTNPVTLYPRQPAAGTRVVRIDGGVLVHSGLPNPGLQRVISDYRAKWERLAVPLILHLVAADREEVVRAVTMIDEVEALSAVELGIGDDLSVEEASILIRAAVERSEKPIMVRVPLFNAELMARAAERLGADAVVVGAPPRGTARDSAGRLVSGRLYGPMIKPLALRMVGQIARTLHIPILGAGGIHSPQDARDYLEAGARAVQVDTVTWMQPRMLERIARDLGGLVLTQPSGAFADEWHDSLGETERNQSISPDDQAVIRKPKPPQG